MKEIDASILIGDFAVYRGEVYREVSYSEEIAIFALEDNEKKHELSRVRKEQASERFSLYTYVFINGVIYIVRELKENQVIYERAVCDKELHTVALTDCDAVIRYRYQSGKPKSYEFFYRNPARFDICSAENRYFPEEMHNGHLMLSYSDDEVSIKETGEILKQMYGKRLQRYKEFNPQTLLFDYYIERLKIDDVSFCLDSDWGIVALSPENADGDQYIREICRWMNAQSRN